MGNLKKRALQMIQSQQDEYIKDGLVLWLDGESQLDDSSIINGWKDLSGNAYQAELQNVVKNADAISFNDADSLGIISSSVAGGVLTGICERTIEIVCKLNNTDNIQVIFLGAGKTTPAENSAAGLWYRPASKGLKVGTSDAQCPSLVTSDSLLGRASYSIVYGDTDLNDYVLYQNGTECQKGTAEGSMYNPTYTTIGCRYYNSYSYRLSGEICCIRVYDRKLSVAEREHNLQIDRRRFDF